MRVRLVNQSDTAAWVDMRSALWPDSSDQHSQEIRQYFDGTSIDIVSCYVVDDGQGEVCGFVELNIRNFAEGSRCPKVPYVEGWYIKPAFQNQGLGKALMHQADLWAKQQGYDELASDTELDNPKSIAIHKHLGFNETERVVCFLKQF